MHLTRVAALLLIFPLLPTLRASASVCGEWNSLDKEIRDNTIERTEARRKIVELNRRLLDEYAGMAVTPSLRFPLKGYTRNGAGARRGRDYKPAGYDFYDGNRHGGHPAHDLFIHDRKRTGVDDRTGKPAEVLAFEDGVVVGVNPAWEYPGKIRGGMYVWVFNPERNRYGYYAHLSKVLVAPGDMVRAGDPIALLGRTGKNAWPRRSPTHLHFMFLYFDNGRMTPHNTWRELLQPREP